jgi:hypothetical protein
MIITTLSKGIKKERYQQYGLKAVIDIGACIIDTGL